MHIADSEEAQSYRWKIRTLISSRLPDDWPGVGGLDAEARREFVTMWRDFLHEHGLLAATWPTEFGGADLSLLERVIVNEELVRAGAVITDVNLDVGMSLLGQTMMALGTDEQKANFLPRILSGEDVWCQGFSEPGSGSDLAGLGTRAVLDGEEWVINGQKIWTSDAHRADWIFLLCRTDVDAVKHKGISFLLVPMNQPGVEIRPVANINRSHDFNEVFFSDATTPADHVLGDVNEGWKVTSFLLGLERGDSATTNAILYRSELDRLVRDAKALGRTTDPLFRQRLATAHTTVEIMRFVGLRALSDLLAGHDPGAEGSLFKLLWSEHHTSVTELALDIIGAHAMTPSGHQPADFFLDLPGAEYSSQSWVSTFLAARSDLIRGGTSEVQRNIVAERVLGLPREPRADSGPWRDVPRS